MMRRILVGVGVGALVLVTAVLVLVALRPPPPPEVPEARVTLGAIAAVDNSIWWWAGPSECTPATDIIQLERQRAGGAWLKSAIPLVNVEALSFRDDSVGIAMGTTTSCARGIAITTDGGAQWRDRANYPVLLDAWWIDDRVWGVVQENGPPSIEAFRLTRKAELVSDPRVDAVTSPCDARDGVASHVAFYDRDVGLLLCEQPVTDERLVARTTTAGATFERLTDSRPETGLDGPGPVLDLDVVRPDWAWTLFPSHEECTEGQLRRSDSQGAVWTRLPCPSESAPVEQVLDAAFTGPNSGLLLGVLDNQPVMLTTSNGGRTWTATS